MSSESTGENDAKSDPKTPTFKDLALSAPILEALEAVGYEIPTPIQAQTIPKLLEGRDLVGQAQTGTGKTAAFALPFLSRLDISQKKPQLLVLTPTRELAIQVAEAFQRYASKIKGFHVLPVYGGQSYEIQLRPLRRGVHVVVGTPGRVMDHMRKGTLDLSQLKGLVLDEADEMLQMGFLEDVGWILEQTPPDRQIALFSATMPPPVRRIARKHLTDPCEIRTEVKRAAADTIRQRFWIAHGSHKLDALTRILETEEYNGIIVFVRTKTATVGLAERLEARGFAAVALNGDVPQNQRERTVERLKAGKLDILVATDVAARGLDVERISHVINYDMPHDVEAYIHRIGRTGRAGRKGEAILFVAPREKRMLQSIERALGNRMERLKMPNQDEVNDVRIARFKRRIESALDEPNLEFFQGLVEELATEKDLPIERIAGALARMAQGRTPLLLPLKEMRAPFQERETSRPAHGTFKERHPRRSSSKPDRPPESGMRRYRIEVGRRHGVRPGNIVGALTHEGGLEGRDIGRISLEDQFSYVDLSERVSAGALKTLNRVWVRGKRLRIQAV